MRINEDFSRELTYLMVLCVNRKKQGVSHVNFGCPVQHKAQPTLFDSGSTISRVRCLVYSPEQLGKLEPEVL